jgi:hypothetical protein
MIPYMDLNEQVDADFIRARRRAVLRAVAARFRREHTSNRLLSFDDVRRELVADNRLYRGTKVVEVEEIVGSVGRWRDFDRSFLPARASMGQRWKRIDRAFHRAEDLPPVELYEIGGPLPRRANGRSRSSRVPPQAFRCTATHAFEERVSSLVSLIHPSAWKVCSRNSICRIAD